MAIGGTNYRCTIYLMSAVAVHSGASSRELVSNKWEIV